MCPEEIYSVASLYAIFLRFLAFGKYNNQCHRAKPYPESGTNREATLGKNMGWTVQLAPVPPSAHSMFWASTILGPS